MKAFTCGIIFLTDQKILLGHSTGNKHWDIPKGMNEPGETPIVTAIRETFEETGIITTPDELIDLGRFRYNHKKDLHLFLCKNKEIDVGKFVCTSFFEMYGKMHPEIDQLAFFDIMDGINNRTQKTLSGVLTKLLPILKE